MLCRSATDNICRLRVHAVSFCLIRSAFCRLRLCHRKGSFFTARNEVGQGYIFTGVCDSVRGGGGGIPACLAGGIPACLAAGGWWYPSMPCRWYPSMPCSRGVCYPSMPCSRGVGLLLGGLLQGGWVETPREQTHPPDGHCCGRYTSYWNAFLFWSENKAMMFPDGFLENPI